MGESPYDATEQMQPVRIPDPQRNGMGLAGFIISLVGFCTGGLLSPIGLVLSFIAMFRKPRGLAIAGFVIGLIGSIFTVVFIALVGIATIVAVVTGLVAGRGALETTVDGLKIRDAVDAVHDDTGAWPTGVGELTGLDPDALQDRWGHPYHVEIDGDAGTLRIVSDGPDGQADTMDDIVFGLDLR